MKGKIIQTAAAGIIAAVIIILVQIFSGGGNQVITSEAQAQIVTSGNLYTINQDTFVITSSDEGSEVYVYHFNREPFKERSSIEFITSAKAK